MIRGFCLYSAHYFTPAAIQQGDSANICSVLACFTIVGYVNPGLEQFEFIGTPLTQIGGVETGLTYKDIKVNCEEEMGGPGLGWVPLYDSIVMLNEKGTFVKSLVYLPKWYADMITQPKGWYDSACAVSGNFTPEDCYNDEPIDFGVAVQVSASVGVGAQAQFSGEVKNAPTVTDVEQFVSVANCAPKTIYGEDIIVNCEEEMGGPGLGWVPLYDSIILLNEKGTFVKSLVYLPKWYADMITQPKGWYDSACAVSGNFTPEDCYNHRDELKVEAGKGFQVSASVGVGATVTIKSALATDAE